MRVLILSALFTLCISSLAQASQLNIQYAHDRAIRGPITNATISTESEASNQVIVKTATSECIVQTKSRGDAQVLLVNISDGASVTCVAANGVSASETSVSVSHAELSFPSVPLNGVFQQISHSESKPQTAAQTAVPSPQARPVQFKVAAKAPVVKAKPVVRIKKSKRAVRVVRHQTHRRTRYRTRLVGRGIYARSRAECRAFMGHTPFVYSHGRCMISPKSYFYGAL